MDIRYQIIVTDLAKSQITNIISYIQNVVCSPIAAQNKLDEIEKALASLKMYPQRCMIYRCIGNRQLRVFYGKNFNIYFVVDNVQNLVVVLAVMLGNRDQEKGIEMVFKYWKDRFNGGS